MTNAQVQGVIQQARSRGVACDEYEACVFLGAKELLAANPENPIAKSVLENYSRFLLTGTKKTSFAEFLLPIDAILTEEDKTP